jgi:hypothetical protein
LRALKGAKITFNHRSSVIDCVVRDLSAHGAKLRVESSVDIPAVFDLVFDADHAIRRCLVAWRSGQELGVRFVDVPPPGASKLSPR